MNDSIWVDEKVNTWIGAKRVGEVMLEPIECRGYVGGTVLEVGSDVLRKIEVLNDPGAGSEMGCTVTNLAKEILIPLKLLGSNLGEQIDLCFFYPRVIYTCPECVSMVAVE